MSNLLNSMCSPVGIILPRRPTWGTSATGEIFRLVGRRRLTSSHDITKQNPALTWYAMSSANRATAAGVRAIGCGPHATAASMSDHDQSGPQSTFIPRRHSFRVGVKGCASAKGCGCMREHSSPCGMSCCKPPATVSSTGALFAAAAIRANCAGVRMCCMPPAPVSSTGALFAAAAIRANCAGVRM
jgi:hypothetical protein